MNVIDLLAREQEKTKVPVIRSGDTVRVHVKVVEGTRERIQVFEGIVIAVRGKHGANTRFTVRRISHGVGVERTFFLHSPRIDKVDILRHGDVRRAKLFYLREKVGKHARIRERREPIGGGPSVMEREAPLVLEEQPSENGKASKDAAEIAAEVEEEQTEAPEVEVGVGADAEPVE